MIDSKGTVINMNDLVSIIMLSRRKARFVEESVRSVIAQTYQNWELLFVDDNSKDGTVSLRWRRTGMLSRIRSMG